MRKFIRIVFTLCCVLLLISCTEESHDSKIVEHRTISLQYFIDEPTTKAMRVADGENRVDDLAFLFYKVSDNSFADYIIRKTPTTGVTKDGRLISLKLPSGIESNIEYKVLVLGNTSAYVFEGGTFEEYIEERRHYSYDVMKQSLITSTYNNQRIVLPLPFAGSIVGAKHEEVTFIYNNTGSTPLSVKLTRIVSRFNLINKDLNRLKIKSVKVCNYQPGGFYFETLGFVNDTVHRGLELNNPGKVEKSQLINGNQKFIEGGLYSFPNRVLSMGSNDNRTTCLLIEGYYKEEGNDEYNDTPVYYRANIGKKGRFQVLRPNYIYTITITEVLTDGSLTEEEAMDKDYPRLEYEISENWDTSDEHTVIDTEGSFITISQKTLLLDNYENSSEIIRVQVKSGDTWTATWKPDSGEAKEAFNLTVLDANSFKVTTRSHNLEDKTKKGTITVKLDGKELSTDLMIYQTKLSDVDPVLIVNGKNHDFDVDVKGEGEILTYEVLTGTESGWKATLDNNLAQFATLVQDQGTNKTKLKIAFKPNIDDDVKHGYLTVSRKDQDNSVSDIRIYFSQVTTEMLIAVYPNYINEVLKVDGMVRNRNVNINGGIAEIIRFEVSLTDPDNYIFKVESTFDPHVEAFAFIESLDSEVNKNLYKTRASYAENDKTSNEQVGYEKGVVSFCVFRTGPGDKPLSGSLIFTAIPKEEAVEGALPQEYAIPVEIVSNCVIGDVVMGNYFIPDRNYGAISKKVQPLGLNYSRLESHPDNSPFNEQFLGSELADTPGFTVSNSFCEQFQEDNYGNTLDFKLKLPNHGFGLILDQNYYISRERHFVLSDEVTPDGKLIGAYIPYANRGYTQDVFTNSNNVSRRGYILQFSPRSDDLLRAFMDKGDNLNSQMSRLIRCVGYLEE